MSAGQVSLLGGSGGLHSSAVGAPLSLEMCRTVHRKTTEMKLGKHVMFESVRACPQCHNDHLVFSGEEVVCILSVANADVPSEKAINLAHVPDMEEE